MAEATVGIVLVLGGIAGAITVSALYRQNVATSGEVHPASGRLMLYALFALCLGCGFLVAALLSRTLQTLTGRQPSARRVATAFVGSAVTALLAAGVVTGAALVTVFVLVQL